MWVRACVCESKREKEGEKEERAGRNVDVMAIS